MQHNSDFSLKLASLIIREIYKQLIRKNSYGKLFLLFFVADFH